MPQPNMKKEYRAELKTLRKNRGVVARDWRAFLKTQERYLRAIKKAVDRGERAITRNLARFDKRIAILEGRLS